MRMPYTGRHRAGSSSYKHPRNGSMTIDSIPEVPGEESPAFRNLNTASSSRSPFQWPFQSQSISHSNNSDQRSRSTSFPRRSSGWINLRPASSILGSDIIPDYVVHFMRGETPESLARKRETEANSQPAGFQHTKNQHSQVGDFFSSHSRSGSRGRDLEDVMALGARKGGNWAKFMTGWRGGITLNILLSLLTLAGVVVCVVLAVLSGKISDEPKPIMEGTCERVAAVDMGIHAALNIVSVFFLASSNYVAQVLTSPTRTEVSVAHNKQSWMDIGIPSLRNLAGISKGKAFSSLLVVFVGIGMQQLYNAMLFTSKSGSGRDSAGCSLLLNGSLLGAAGILNVIFLTILIIVLTRPSSSNSLVTIGDAIASFLMEPDHATEGACLVTKADITSGQWGCGQARYWFTQSHRWVNTPSKMRWMVWFVTWLLPTGMAAAMLGMAVVDGPKNAFSSLSEPTSTYALPKGIPSFGLSLILALPHFLLALAYYSTNALLTVFYLSHEFSQFARPGAAESLRISSGNPLGSQTTSLYLTLPRPLSWTLFILFATMGFLLSQCINLLDREGSVSFGLNALPLVILLGLLVLVVILVIVLSTRRADLPPATEDGRRAGNALALKGGSCSAVISARCHRSAGEGAAMASMPLAWGVVHDDNSASKVGHAAFSALPVEPLNVAKAYA